MVGSKDNYKFDLGVKGLSGGMIDMWYLEWQKQEKYIELFPKKLDVHKKKCTLSKKSHWSGGLVDLWYLE